LRGILVAGLLFVIFGALLFDTARQYSSTSHQVLLLELCGPYMGRAIDALLTLFLFASLGVMLAAAGVLIGDLLGFSFSVGVVGTALLTRFLVLGDSTRLLKV